MINWVFFVLFFLFQQKMVMGETLNDSLIQERKSPFNPIKEQNKGFKAQNRIKKLKNGHISLNFQDIKLQAALQLLAEFTGINLVVSDKVRGNLTLRLHDIPWDQALDIILTTKTLSKRKIGNAMFIAPTEDILVQEKNNVDRQKDQDNWGPLFSDLLQINYAKASDIALMLKEHSAFLTTQGTISADVRTNTLWVQESKVNLVKIRHLVKLWDVPVKQVLIEARIVNVTKDFARDLGLRFAYTQDKLKSNELANPIHAPLSKRLSLDFGALAVPHVSLGLALAQLSDGILLDLELAALESEGRGEIISSPKLITSNQQGALIEAGEEIPYQETTSSGGTSVVFKKAVLRLKVTPQVTADAKIGMDLHLNQDIPSLKQFNGVPSILTKEIKTHVLVNDGQTIVLGGIYKQNKQKSVSRIPLPILRAIFKSQTTTLRNEELLIFITPRIIPNSVAAKAEQGPAGGIDWNKFGKSTLH